MVMTSNNVGVFSVISLWIASAFEAALGTAFLCAFIDTDKTRTVLPFLRGRVCVRISNCLNWLVAGRGFEPLTFGL